MFSSRLKYQRILYYLCSFTAGGTGVPSLKDTCRFTMDDIITVNFTKDDGNRTLDEFKILEDKYFIYLSKGFYDGENCIAC